MNAKNFSGKHKDFVKEAPKKIMVDKKQSKKIEGFICHPTYCVDGEFRSWEWEQSNLERNSLLDRAKKKMLMFCGIDDNFDNSPDKSVFPWKDNPFRLWSLLDMLRVSAEEYIKIGEKLHEISVDLYIIEHDEHYPYTNGYKDKVKNILINLEEQCDKLELKLSSQHLERKINDIPQGKREIVDLVNIVKDEIRDNLFLFIPSYRAKYYERNLSESFTTSFPNASRELIKAGNCFATNEYTACVFHSMRSAELGLRSLAEYLHIPLKPVPWGLLLMRLKIK